MRACNVNVLIDSVLTTVYYILKVSVTLERTATMEGIGMFMSGSQITKVCGMLGEMELKCVMDFQAVLV